MPTRAWIFLFLLSFTAGSCASGPQLVPIKNPDQRIEFEGFSVLPPSGAGWGFQGTGILSTPLTMMKDISRPSHSMVASVGVISLRADFSEGKKHGEILEFLVQQKTNDLLAFDRAKNRFSLLESKTKPREIGGQPCIEWSAKFLDRAAPANPGKVLERTGEYVICTLPEMPSIAISLEYSERFEPGAPKQHYFNEGRRFLESLRFTPFPYQVTAWRVGRSPQHLLLSRGFLWISDFLDDAVIQFDPAAGKVVQRIPVGEKPLGLLEVPDGILVANTGDGTVSLINSAGKVSRKIDVGGNPVSISWFESNLAVCNAPKGQITVLDEKSLDIVGKIPVAGRFEIAWCETMKEELWASVGFADFGAYLARISGGSVKSTFRIGGRVMGMVIHNGSAWVAVGPINSVKRINWATGEKEAEIKVGESPAKLAVTDNQIWVTNVRSGTVSRINAEQFTAVGQPLALGVGIAGMAVVGDTLWISNVRSGLLFRITKK